MDANKILSYVKREQARLIRQKQATLTKIKQGSDSAMFVIAESRKLQDIEAKLELIEMMFIAGEVD